MKNCGLCGVKLCCPFRKLCSKCKKRLAKADELARLAADPDHDTEPWTVK